MLYISGMIIENERNEKKNKHCVNHVLQINTV